MFTSDTRNGHKKELFYPSHFKEDAHVPVVKRAMAHHLCQESPGEDAAGDLFWRLHKAQFSYWVSGDYLSPKKV
jgi:hypothetical protein